MWLKTSILISILQHFLIIIPYCVFNVETFRPEVILNSPASVTSTLGQKVDLKWNYNLNTLPSKIIFYRENSGHQDEHLAVWSNKTFIQIPRQFNWLDISLVKSDNGIGWAILLEIQESDRRHYNWIYYCHVVTEKGTSYKAGIELKLESPKWKKSNKSVSTKLGSVAMFHWEYEYKFKSNAVVFRKKDTSNNIVNCLGFWFLNDFYPGSNYTNRLNTTIVATESGEIINLKLYSVQASDFNFVYDCYIILNDGRSIIWETQLMEVPKMVTVAGAEVRLPYNTDSGATSELTSKNCLLFVITGLLLGIYNMEPSFSMDVIRNVSVAIIITAISKLAALMMN